MNPPNFVLLYVTDPLKSAAFYEAHLSVPIVESSPHFAMLALPGGMMLGLWDVAEVLPPTRVTGGGTELAITTASNAEVDQLHADWKGRGMPIAQSPTSLDFGYTFVGLDPDGHRLRVFHPPARG